MRDRVSRGLVVWALFVSGCGDPSVPLALDADGIGDAGIRDTGAVDGSVVDAGLFDGGPAPLDAADAGRDAFDAPSSCADADGDGHAWVACGGLDCDDTRADVSPTDTEVCNGIDDDCDTRIDELVSSTFYVDADGDGFGVDDAATNAEACTLAVGFTTAAGDCDDAAAAVHPGAVDVCDAAMIDDDCSGAPNDPPGGCACTGSSSRACVAPGVCAAGIESCVAGLWGACSIAPTAESCDGSDEDCDGAIDEGVTVDCYRDDDDDGVASPGATQAQLCPVSGREPVGGCPVGFTDQPPASPGCAFAVSPTTRTIAAAAVCAASTASVSVTVTVGCAWTPAIDIGSGAPGWLTIVSGGGPQIGTGAPQTVTYRAASNRHLDARSGTITIVDGASAPTTAVFTLSQANGHSCP